MTLIKGLIKYCLSIKRYGEDNILNQERLIVVYFIRNQGLRVNTSTRILKIKTQLWLYD
ncbi:14104_t:CDS:2 [Cetraspora pellucida]|uniref:14104_t:CDS:1 n=1 Tax=Cetraspora pellucida TaxID=1433469 RepID=A0A9N9BA58_9GLOM|nr:14104_t:CDS:2 [Cetraspora pellucida]